MAKRDDECSPSRLCYTAGPWFTSSWAKHTDAAGRPSGVFADDDGSEIDICLFPKDTEVTLEEESANAFAIAQLPEVYEALRNIKWRAEFAKRNGGVVNPETIFELMRKVSV